MLGSPLWYRVGPWPAIRGWTRNLYSSIRSSRSSSVASLPLPRSTPAGVASLSLCTLADFNALCEDLDLRVEACAPLSGGNPARPIDPARPIENLRAETVLFFLSRRVEEPTEPPAPSGDLFGG